MRRGAVLLLMLVLLTACGASNSGLSTDDLAIVRVDDEKQIVQYGMSRAAAEKVLGEASGNKNYLSYENGVEVLYRDNSVVLLSLGEESKGVYKTIQGAEINMNKGEMKEIYGEDQAIEIHENNLDYLYDSINKKYLTDIEVNSEERKSFYHISFMFNEQGEAESIFLSDNNASMFLN
ncbi:hypothetical protein GCM10010912_17410 [Paenibacillus albidus]|uniref:DUF4309 domain-containing protein n=1 Tax=Paenibacillus albidus TaxID=2041023 RepID=A0A917C6K4_9BACL|nr:hypothetical protein [Paenibacillus albidus]GGF72718.1 hypothetical protein GCM10010912_17410 [Paenibacillus albidus]